MRDAQGEGPHKAKEADRERAAIRGDLAHFGLFDLAQSLMHGGKTGLLTVTSQEGRHGYLYFDHGEVVHAMDDSYLLGPRAAATIFLWTEGSFEFDSSRHTAERTIRGGTEALILEVARLIDEASRDRKLDGPSVTDILRSKATKNSFAEINKVFAVIARRALQETSVVSTHLLDRLLASLHQAKGDALFIAPGAEPRARVAGKLLALGGGQISQREVDKLAEEFLTPIRKRELSDGRECRLLLRRGADLPPVKVVASPGPTGTIFTFSPIYDVTRHIEKATDLPPDVAAVVSAGRGLILVASRPVESAALYLGALVGHVVESGGSLATVLVESIDFALEPQHGLAVVMEVSEPDGDYSDTILRTLDRKPAVIALSPLRSSRTAIAIQHASRFGCIAIATVEAGEMSEAAEAVKSLFAIPPTDPVAVVLTGSDPSSGPLPQVKGTLAGKALRLLLQ